MSVKTTYWFRSKKTNEVDGFGRRPVPAQFKKLAEERVSPAIELTQGSFSSGLLHRRTGHCPGFVLDSEDRDHWVLMPTHGIAFLRAIPALEKLELEDDEQIGVTIVKRALEEPLRLIACNAGHEGAVVVGKVRDSKRANFGSDATTEEYTDMISAGIRSGQSYPFCPTERGVHRGFDAHDGSSCLGDTRIRKSCSCAGWWRATDGLSEQ